jgi:hypothetical protein
VNDLEQQLNDLEQQNKKRTLQYEEVLLDLLTRRLCRRAYCAFSTHTMRSQISLIVLSKV